MEQAAAHQIGNATWQVTLEVKARKLAIDSVGVETEVTMDDSIEIGIFAEGQQPPADVEVEQVGDADTPSCTRRHRIRSGQQTITVTMPRRPARAVIDPNGLLNQAGATSDNTMTVTTKG